MCRSSFRIKVDLSQLCNDVRRMSQIYVDKDSITHVHHVQNHIRKIFDLQNPFYLLLNDTDFLPPNEDSRILRESDILVVVPGTVETIFNSSVAGESNVQTVVTEASAVINENHRIDSPNATNATCDRTMYSTLNNDSQMDKTSESVVEQSTVTENSNVDMTPLKNKRKRVRRRKSKHEIHSEVAAANVKISPQIKKPKIINSRTIPSGKHIRFDELQKEENLANGNRMICDVTKVPGTSSANKEESSWNKSLRHSAEGNLTALLSLRQSSTPITFATTQVEEDKQKINIPEPVQPDVTKIEHPIAIDPKKHPVMETQPHINDVIAFKMLKISNDYTPEISDYIVAQLVEFSSDTSMYIFKILEGKDQIQEPHGKFDIKADEVEEKDTIELTWPQLFEPRFLFNNHI